MGERFNFNLTPLLLIITRDELKMQKEDINKMWDDVVVETSKRSKGSIWRGIKYGNKSKVFGQNKGLRKAARNAPKKIILGTLDFAGLAPGLGATIGMFADFTLSKGKELYSAEIKPKLKNKPINAQEQMRKKIKEDVKKLGSNAFQVIDRNLVKMKDAARSVSPAVKELMKAAPDMSYSKTESGQLGQGMSPDADKQMEKAHLALRKIAETEYYIDKEVHLVKALIGALTELETDLNKMEGMVQKSRDEVMDYLELAID